MPCHPSNVLLCWTRKQHKVKLRHGKYPPKHWIPQTTQPHLLLMTTTAQRFLPAPTWQKNKEQGSNMITDKSWTRPLGCSCTTAVSDAKRRCLTFLVHVLILILPASLIVLPLPSLDTMPSTSDSSIQPSCCMDVSHVCAKYSLIRVIRLRCNVCLKRDSRT